MEQAPGNIDIAEIGRQFLCPFARAAGGRDRRRPLVAWQLFERASGCDRQAELGDRRLRRPRDDLAGDLIGAERVAALDDQGHLAQQFGGYGGAECCRRSIAISGPAHDSAAATCAAILSGSSLTSSPTARTGASRRSPAAPSPRSGWSLSRTPRHAARCRTTTGRWPNLRRPRVGDQANGKAAVRQRLRQRIACREREFAGRGSRVPSAIGSRPIATCPFDEEPDRSSKARSRQQRSAPPQPPPSTSAAASPTALSRVRRDHFPRAAAGQHPVQRLDQRGKRLELRRPFHPLRSTD